MGVTKRVWYTQGSIKLQIRYREKGTTTWKTTTLNYSDSTGDETNKTAALRLPMGEYEYQVKILENEHALPVNKQKVTASVSDPIHYELTSNEVDRIGVAISFPSGLYHAASNSSKLQSYTVFIRVEYRELGTEDWIGKELKVTGDSQSAIRRIVEFKYLNRAKYEIRAYFTKPPETDERYGSDAVIEFIQEGIKDDFTYPGTSLYAVRALATDQLQGALPKVTIKASRDYVPVWYEGEYVYKSAQNPAWACYDMIHNTRYGGGVAGDRINYDEFESWAEYCDEKDYRFCMYFDAQTTLAEAINHASTCGRGMVVQRGTDFGCIVERPSAPVQMFNVSNIIADTFKEVFTPKNERANCIEITYFDENKDWDQCVIEVRDPSFDESLDPIIRTSITLYGCPTEQQAFAYGRFLLNQNKHLSRTVTFEADVDSIVCQLGDVIYLQHDLPEWGIEGGRLDGAGENTVIFDKEVTLEPDIQYAVIVRHNDSDKLETKKLKAVAEKTTAFSFEVESPFEKVPAIGSLFTLGLVESVAKKFRVTQLTKSQDFRRKITCLEYRDDVYADIGTSVDDTANESNLESVSNLSAREIWKTSGNNGKSVAHVTWHGTAISWNVFYRDLNTSAWKSAGRADSPEFDIETLEIGKSYYIAVSETKSPTDGEITTLSIQGKAAPPADVESLYVSQSKGRLVIQWPHVSDGDLLGYIVKEGVSWEKGRAIGDLCHQNETTWTPPESGSYTLWIKAIDDSRIESRNATSRLFNYRLISTNEVVRVDEITKTTPCDGESADFIFCDSTDQLVLISGMTDQTLPNLTDADLIAYDGATKLVGNYYTSKVYDLGQVNDFTLKASAAFESVIRNPTDQTIYDRTDQDFPLDTDAHITSFASYSVQYRISDDNIHWSDWQDCRQPIDCYGRYYQIRYEASMDTYSTSFDFGSLVSICDAPDVEFKIHNQSISSSGQRYALADLGVKIFAQYSVYVSPIGSTPINYTIDKTLSEFTIHLFDQAGNPISGTVDFTIRGI